MGCSDVDMSTNARGMEFGLFVTIGGARFARVEMFDEKVEPGQSAKTPRNARKNANKERSAPPARAGLPRTPAEHSNGSLAFLGVPGVLWRF